MNRSRRAFVKQAVQASLAMPWVGLPLWGRIATGRAAELAKPDAPIGIGFSLYGMRSLPLADALTACRTIGYDSVELPVMADWPADSAQFGVDAQRVFREQLEETGLRLSGLMENLVLLAPADGHAANLARITAAGRIARSLSPERPPVVETILGGKPEQWNDVRSAMVSRLKEWGRAADDAGATIAIKPHVAGAVHTPEDAVWLCEETAHPRIKAAFDFSHYQLRGRQLGECLDRLLDKTVFIHVKDARGTQDKFQFLLPGEGTIDYVDYFRRLATGRYQGDVVVEVSGQIHSNKDYDPLVAAKRSHAALAAAARQAGVRP